MVRIVDCKSYHRGCETILLQRPRMNPSVSTRPQKPSAGEISAAVPELLSLRSSLILGFCFAAAVFAVYYGTLDFQFILDDHRFVGDPRIQSSGYLWDYFSNYTWAQYTGGPPSFYRPLFIVWMRINYILNEASPWGWHLLSILKHLAAAALLGLLAWKLLADRTAAIFAAVLFALHPAQVESVAWATVPDPLMAVGISATLLFYLKYVESFRAAAVVAAKTSRKSARAASVPKPSPGWLIASAAACLASLLVKETAIVLPVIMFVLALFLPPGMSSTSTDRESDSWLLRFKCALQRTWLFAAVAVFYLFLRMHAFGGKLGSRTQQISIRTVVFSWPATLWFYVKALVWPVRSYSFADPRLIDRFSFREILLPALAVCCFAAIMAAAFVWAWKKTGRGISGERAAKVRYALLVAVLLLVLPILPTLDLNALNPGDFLHGRYTYLPSAGAMLLLAALWHLAGKARLPLLGAAAVLVVVFATLTASQEKQWHDDLTVFTVAHQLAPHNSPVARNLANAHVQQALPLAEEGRCNEALPVFEQVTQQFPEDWFAWAAFGDCLVQINNLPRAEDALHRAASLSHDSQVVEHWQELRTHMGLPNSAP